MGQWVAFVIAALGTIWLANYIDKDVYPYHRCKTDMEVMQTFDLCKANDKCMVTTSQMKEYIMAAQDYAEAKCQRT